MWTKELEEWPKLCALKELVRGGFEARCVREEKEEEKNTDEAKAGYSRAVGGEMERYKEGGEEVYRL